MKVWAEDVNFILIPSSLAHPSLFFSGGVIVLAFDVYKIGGNEIRRDCACDDGLMSCLSV